MMIPTAVQVYLVIELIRISDLVDTTVGWSCCLPQTDKVSIIKGAIDYSIRSFRQFDQLVCSDLNNWLCNLHLTVECITEQVTTLQSFKVETKLSLPLTSDRTPMGTVKLHQLTAKYFLLMRITKSSFY